MTGPRRPGGPARAPKRSTPSRQAPSERARRADPAREVAAEVLRAVREDDAYANLVLPLVTADRRLDTRDAALATELTYGTLRGQGFYDPVVAACVDRPLADLDPPVLDALRLGAHQLLATRIPPHAAVSQTVALVRAAGFAGAAGLVNAVLRRVGERTREQWQAEVAPDRDADLVGHLAVVHSHPPWVVRAFRESLASAGRDPGEVEALLQADNAAPRVTLAARPGLADVAELVAAGASPSGLSPWGAVLPGGDPVGVPAVRDGRARVQDEGSQLVALALAAAPLGDGAGTGRWLDLCAGPGGKAALLAGLAAQQQVSLVAVEVSEHRARLVERSLAVRGGLSHEVPVVEVRRADGREVGADEPAAYDRVLVDAPCTGLGALRRRPEARWRRQPSDLATLGPLQRALLASALDAVRPGGVVAYATCSPHVAETTAVVDDVLRRRDDVELLPAPEALAVAAGRTVPDVGPGPTAQLWPHLHGTDAMFLALLRRR